MCLKLLGHFPLGRIPLGTPLIADAPLLTVEIGNSRIKFGLFLDWNTSSENRLPACVEVMAVPADAESIPWNQVLATVGSPSPRCVVASVNPQVLARFLSEFPRTGWPEPLVIRSYRQLPIDNLTSPPEQTGMDRLLKGVAGNVVRPADTPLILIDSGTATTVDRINSAGQFTGGAILPGLSLASRALHDHTAQLPLILSESFIETRPAVIGTNTVAALQSGLYWGHVGAVRELIARNSNVQAERPPAILITGGAGELLARELNLSGSYHPNLTLQGLAVTARHLFSNLAT